MKEEIEKRRMEAAERMKSLSTSSTDGEEIFSPFSPKASTQKVPVLLQSGCGAWTALTLHSDCLLFSDQLEDFKYEEGI